ncbi:alpha/beta fold hydrolase [Zavarzinia sp. CC-PAN008]|uniref:alpha/beta fold hydrolase n=1 Tax=Zavarzinia sp. CC-PAN008 TaxID=3243332 RepID=UPI003F7495F8
MTSQSMPTPRMIETNGIRMGVYEAGPKDGPAIVLCHGFPELAYSWRHQIPALAAAGYHVLAPDQRGYGLTEVPERVEDYDLAHLLGDLVGMLDAVGVPKAVFAGHDWGGLLVWQMALLHPTRVAGVIGVNTPHIPHHMLWLHPDLVRDLAPGFVADPAQDPLPQMRRVYSPDMYVINFHDTDAADRMMARDVPRVFRSFMRKGVISLDVYRTLPPEMRHMAITAGLEGPEPADLPGTAILSAEELGFYVQAFERTGFTGGINWYRNLSRNWLLDRGVDQVVRVPSLMIAAGDDVVLTPAMTDEMPAIVPDLERHVIPACGHWSTQEKPHEVNALMLDWLRRRFPV